METEERVDESQVSVVQGGILKADNEAQQSWAMAHKRSMIDSRERSIAELEAFPEAAATAWYSIPYKESDGKGGFRTVNVEGPSIKAATALMRNWQNCTSGSLIVGETDDRVQVLGFFFDVENNIRKFKPFNISKMAWNKKTQTSYRLADHKLVMAIQAGASKAERNAILSGLPQGLIDLYVARAKEIVASGGKSSKITEAPKDRILKLYKAFEKWNVTAAMLDKYIDDNAEEFGTPQAIITGLTGLGTAIKDGQVSVEEVFEMKPVEAPKIEGQTTLDDVIRQAPK